MNSDLRCQECGHTDARYRMQDEALHRSIPGDGKIVCSNMYHCLKRRAERMEATIKRHGAMLKEHDNKLLGDWPTKEADEKRIKDWKVGGTD